MFLKFTACSLFIWLLIKLSNTSGYAPIIYGLDIKSDIKEKKNSLKPTRGL